MTQTTNVPLSASQIHFLLDLMMGCPLGYTHDHAYHRGVDPNTLYNQLENCLPTVPQHAE